MREEQWSCLLSPHEPAVLDIVRHDRSHMDLRTQNGYVRFRLRKQDSLSSGKEWLLTDSNTAESTPVVLRSGRLSRAITIKHGKGLLTRLRNGLFSSGGSFRWETEAYRWTSSSDKLMLVDTSTDRVHAMLSSTAYPWSRHQGRLMIFGSNFDSKWMRVVIGSALAEAAKKTSCSKVSSKRR